MSLSLRPFFLAAVLTGTTFAAVAQTSIMRPPSRPEPGGGDPRNIRPDAPDDRQYEYGREIFGVKIACRTCPLAGAYVDEPTARRVLAEPDLRASLTEAEDAAVKLYLKRYFGIIN